MSTAEMTQCHDQKKPILVDSDFARAMNVLGPKWVLMIIYELRNGPIRFVEFGRRLGISTEQSRVCLSRLQAHGIVTRTRYRETPPRVEYELTDKARALIPILDQLRKWSKEHM